MRITISCPHCAAKATAVDSREMSRTMREITYRCNNYRCGHVYVASLEVVRTLSLSSIPAADVQLPISRHVRREQLSLQLTSAEAEHVASLHQPIADWGAQRVASAAPA